MEENNIEQIEEIPPYNVHEPYIPVEYALIDWSNSWKKCRCGRITRFNDNWCPSCGQKLGKPDFDD